MSREKLIDLRKQFGNSSELAGLFLENLANEDIVERINPYPLGFDRDGEPRYAYEKKSVLGMAEYQGAKNISELIKNGCKYVFWLSPEGGRSIYTEGRICVGVVKKNIGEIELECRGIPIKVDAEEMFYMAKKIQNLGGRTIGDINCPEDIREQSIGIELNSDADLWNLCEEVFGMTNVWNAIRKGIDIRNKEKAEKVVVETLGEVKKYFGDIGRHNSELAGAFMEMLMGKRGYMIVAGNHGGLNSDNDGTLFDRLFTGIEVSAKIETRDGKCYCSVCQKELSVGTTICPECGLTLTKE